MDYSHCVIRTNFVTFSAIKIGILTEFIVTSFCLLVLLAFLPTSQVTSTTNISGANIRRNQLVQLISADAHGQIVLLRSCIHGRTYLRLSKFELFGGGSRNRRNRAFGQILRKKFDYG